MVDEAPEPDEPPRRRTGYEPQRGTVYGVRFGTPGNLPGPLPKPKERRWIPLALVTAGIVLLAALVLAAVALA